MFLSFGSWFEKIKVHRKWLIRLGGEIYNQYDYSLLFNLKTFLAPEYTLVTVIIQDNGIGINERIMENKSPGFGLTIVKMLVEQLKGTYSIVNENGTKSVIQFEI